MHPELNSLESFVEWLKEQPYITGNILLTAVCEFTGDDSRGSNHAKNTHSWDKGYHDKCMLAIGDKDETGGVSGGSCWDSSNPTRYYSTPSIADVNNALVDIVSYFDETIPMLAFMKIQRLIRSSSYTKYEYYGNNTEYASRYILVEDLYRELTAWLAKKKQTSL